MTGREFEMPRYHFRCLCRRTQMGKREEGKNVRRRGHLVLRVTSVLWSIRQTRLMTIPYFSSLICMFARARYETQEFPNGGQ